MSTSSHGSSNRLIIHIGHEELVIRRRYEVASILNDFLAAVWFAIGSVFFLFDSLVTPGAWLFVVGSVQLGIRPAIRLRRRIHLRRLDSSTGAETARDF